MLAAEWFATISAIADDSRKYMAGRLIRVAGDAPERAPEWPIMLFRVPPIILKVPTTETAKTIEDVPAISMWSRARKSGAVSAAAAITAKLKAVVLA